jgi:hypothetical protein
MVNLIVLTTNANLDLASLLSQEELLVFHQLPKNPRNSVCFIEVAMLHDLQIKLS